MVRDIVGANLHVYQNLLTRQQAHFTCCKVSIDMPTSPFYML